MIDGHVHLENGPLTIAYVKTFVKQAKAKGIDTIQILDHTHRFIEFAPIYESLRAMSEQQNAWLETKLHTPLAEYHLLIKECRKIDFGIKVLFGLEVCFAINDIDFIRKIVSKFDYDFLIGSVHSIDGRLYDMKALSKELLWDKYTVDHIYKRYYEIMAVSIESGLFTQIGHPDQIKLFNHVPTYDLVPTYNHISELAKKHSVKMEHNTGIHYRYGHADLGTNNMFLKIMKEEQVEIICASDAHIAKDVGRDISLAMQEYDSI